MSSGVRLETALQLLPMVTVASTTKWRLVSSKMLAYAECKRKSSSVRSDSSRSTRPFLLTRCNRRNNTWPPWPRGRTSWSNIAGTRPSRSKKTSSAQLGLRRMAFFLSRLKSTEKSSTAWRRWSRRFNLTTEHRWNQTTRLPKKDNQPKKINKISNL